MRDWQNEIFCDLHSTVLDGEQGRTRLGLVLWQFRPDYLIVSIDQHGNSTQGEKPLIGWLREQSYLHEEYCDDIASAFRVLAQPPAPPGLQGRLEQVHMTP